MILVEIHNSLEEVHIFEEGRLAQTNSDPRLYGKFYEPATGGVIATYTHDIDAIQTKTVLNKQNEAVAFTVSEAFLFERAEQGVITRVGIFIAQLGAWEWNEINQIKKETIDGRARTKASPKSYFMQQDYLDLLSRKLN